MSFIRIKLIVPFTYYFPAKEQNELTLKIGQRTFTFSVSTIEASNFRTYTFKSNDFDFEINDDTVQKIRDSLCFLCLEMSIGILLNPELKSSWFSESFLSELSSINNANVIDDFIGVKVIPDGTICMTLPPPTVTSSVDIKTFEELFNKYVNLEYKNTERLLRAIEIYNSSNYLSIINQSARFILLMSAVEALIEQESVSKKLQNSLTSYIKRIKELKIKSDEKSSILTSLSFLKKISIKRSGKMLVNTLLDKDKRYNAFPPDIFFGKAYDLRSRFVHYGITKTKDLSIRTIQMQDFTMDLLKTYFEKVCVKKSTN
jgi:hypothetical protein